jgi:tryptophan-rich sensory protein
MLALLGFLGVCFFAAFLGARATMGAVVTWYPTLVKPSWNPPAWVFGPVWTLLYAMMAVAAWLVWRRVDWGVALTVFGVQLALNVAWSFCFFALRNPLAGLVDILLLWVAIAVTMVLFWRVDRLAGWLLVPYLFWVTFATMLNFSIWRLNQ